MKPALPSDDRYRLFVAELWERVLAARASAARAVNRDLVLLYWDLGRAIVEQQAAQGWGDSVVEQIAADLRREFPGMSGFSTPNVWRMRQLYQVHTSKEFLSQAVRELAASIPWGHHANVLAKVADPAARLYYLTEAIRPVLATGATPT